MFYMAAPQARGKSAGDNIFAANGRAAVSYTHLTLPTTF